MQRPPQGTLSGAGGTGSSQYLVFSCILWANWCLSCPPSVKSSFLIMIKRRPVGHSPRLCMSCRQWSPSQCASTPLRLLTQISDGAVACEMPLSAFHSFCKEVLPISCPLCLLDYLFHFKDFFYSVCYNPFLLLIVSISNCPEFGYGSPFKLVPQQSELLFTFWRSKTSQAWGGARAGRTQPPGPQKPCLSPQDRG